MAGRIMAAVVAGLMMAGAGRAADGATTTVTGAAAAPSPVERGAYLAKLLSCAGCHSPWGPAGQDAAKLYGGTDGETRNGRHEPGTPNISSDPATGVGKWTDEQLVAAIREGKRPDGTRLAPRMPSAAYHGMTDADAAALVAFLRTVPPVAHEVKREKPRKAESAKWPVLLPAVGNTDPADIPGHGGYLVGLLRCAGCHTPKKGPAAGKAYAGGNEFPQGPGKSPILSSNITSDHETGIGGWKAEDVVNAVRQGVRPDGTELGGPMGWLPKSWSALTDADANALAAFIKAIPPVVNKVRAGTATAKAGT